ncbi:WD40 domain-containing protein [Histoplasma capsulatum H143]|uniref:WD40 domain-containing protein n=1 Tax=Ajellomyces capsulatus (strain H143) TaxID=544712 RepID=C6HLL0_AJECH|nr:WD40 domain-containing protein [Histoplasma capsulatum H143]
MDGFDEETFKKFFPSGFGKQDKSTNVEAQIDRTKRTEVKSKLQSKFEDNPKHGNDDDGEEKERKAVPTISKADLKSNEHSKSESESESDNSDDSEDEFPTSHELTFKTHERAVTTITLDPSGSRMITGSTDCTIKLHDFASMTPTTLRAFKSVEPSAKKQSAASEIHPVHVARFNPLYPSQVLVISATPQAKIFDRDGDMITEFVKGDMYLRDMRNTKGHISEITSGAWSPTDYNLCVTAGTDSTLRIWDVNVGRSQKEVIVHQSRVAGSAGRTRMTAVAWATPVQGGSNILVASALDGSLVMWSGDGPFLRPSAQIQGAHTKDTWTSGLDISPDGRLVVTRGGDDTIKLWDTRKFKTPITTVSHISGSKYSHNANIMFSPSGANIITGSETGDLHILNPATLKPELSTPVTPGFPLIAVFWHEKLNQIVAGSANGETHVLYNPSMSHNGAVLVMSKAPKRWHVDDDPNFSTDLSLGLTADSATGQIASGASFSSRHPTIGLTASGRSRDPRRPHLPNKTPFAQSQPDEKHIKENIPLSSMRDEDPREALLKYAEKAEKEPVFTKVWKETQPNPIFAELSEEEDEERKPERKRVRRD